MCASASTRRSASRQGSPRHTGTEPGGAGGRPRARHLGPERGRALAETPTLELKGVSKSFGAVQALYQVDFQVYAGEVMALVGDNGAGKSTLIKGVAGIQRFDSGEILY